MLRRDCCASPVSESVHGRLGFSRVIEEQREGQHRWGEERSVSRGPATPCHVRKKAVLYADGDVLLRSGEWPILILLTLSQKLSSHIDLCAVDGIDGKIEETMRGNKWEYSNLFPQWAEFT